MKLINLLLSLFITTSSCHSDPQMEGFNSEKMNEEKELIAFVNKNNLFAVETALKNGANVNSADNNKRSLLLIATNNEHAEMAKLLVKYKADVNQQASNKDTTFLYAGASGQTELVKLFLDNDARFDVCNRYNGSALIPACERGHVETVYLLANTKNYPINHINRLGWTALMEAIILGDGSKNYQQIVQILRDAGARMDIPDHDGKTPLQHAQSRKFTEIINILKS